MHLFDPGLAGPFRARQVLVWRNTIVILQIDHLICLTVLVLLLMHLKIDIGSGKVLPAPLVENLLPDLVHLIRHLVNLGLLFVEAPLHFLLCLDQKLDFLCRHTILLSHLLLVHDFLSNEPEALHVERDHAQRDPCFVVLELLFE